MKVLLTLLATASWFAFSHYWYTCQLVAACYGCAATVVVDNLSNGASGVEREAAIRFEPATAELLRGKTFAALEGALKRGQAPDAVLVATGFYDIGDPTPSGFENLGEARAAAAVASLFPGLPKGRYRTNGSLRTTAETELPGVEGADLRWVSAAEAQAIDAASASNPASANVAPVTRTTADNATIRFPFDDADRSLDPALDVYLDELAQRLSSTTERVQLTGHTDDTGSDDYNVDLGQRRAAFIQERLVARGINAARIELRSSGEAKPVSTNASEAGKALNRRVDITVTSATAQQ